MRAVMFASDKGDLPFVMALKNNLTATTDPTVSNDSTQGYEAGAQWLNVTANRAWVCLSNAAGAAVWGLDGGANSNVVTQVTPASQDTAATLTAAQMLTGIITSNPAGPIALTMPLATAMDTAFGASAPVNTSLDFSVINISASNVITMTTNTGWTLTGSGVMTVAGVTSARFRARKTGAGAWTLYRIS